MSSVSYPLASLVSQVTNSDRDLVDPNLVINPTACLCKKHPLSCTRVVIERYNKGTFIVRRKSADGLPTWNLAIFKYPPHDDFQDLSQAKKVKSLELNFSTVKGKSISMFRDF